MTENEFSDLRHIGKLWSKAPLAVRLVNLITLYRIFAFPILIALLLDGETEWFKWLLLACFLTDAIDGFLARQFKATSVLGSKLDSIGDDLTVLAAIVGVCMLHWEFVEGNVLVIAPVIALYLVQLGLALWRYGRISTFHTYLAKVAAVITAVFLLTAFFFEPIWYPLFYLAIAATALDMMEEIALVLVMKEDRSDVKGLYWVLRERKRQ